MSHANAYRDEIASLRARNETLEREAATRDAALRELRRRLAERDALFARLQAVAQAKPPRRWPYATMGAAICATAAWLVAFAHTHARADAATPPVATSASSPPSSPTAMDPTPPPAPAPFTPVTTCGDTYLAIVHADGTTECLATDRIGGELSARILATPDGTPHLIVDGEGTQRGLDIAGPVTNLPGVIDGLRVRIRDGERDYRESTSSHVRITRFGAIGEKVEGDVDAVMIPRLNEPPERIHAVFSVVRGRDRHGP
jgi:hypothetical protein